MIPIAVLIATQRYTEHQAERDLQREEDRREEDRKRLQQEAIKNYISQLSTIYLSTTGEMNEQQDEDVRTLISSLTKALLQDQSLDGSGKRQVIGFLIEMNMLHNAKRSENKGRSIFLSLDGADFSSSDFGDMNLSHLNLSALNLRSTNFFAANLSFADLSKSNLWYAQMLGANLSSANLSETHLGEASLYSADLKGADLGGATITGVNLINTNLDGTNLNGAYIFHASLRNVRGLTEEQLSKAFLCNVQLPDGSESDRDCAVVKTWVEDRISVVKEIDANRRWDDKW